MPFNTTIVNKILSSNVGNYVGLLTGEEVTPGTLSYTEPPIDNSQFSEQGGYQRAEITEWNTNIDRQIANNFVVLMFEARSALVGTTFTHFGLFDTGLAGQQYSTMYPLKFYGELTEPLTIDAEGYVPLIRACELIIGMDTEIKTNYEDYA